MTRRRFAETALKRRLDDYGGACAECGIPVGGAAGLEFDHITPLEMGGEDSLANLQPLCRGCHKSKTATDVRAIRRAQRLERRAQGIGPTRRAVIPGSKGSRWRKRLDGTVEER